MEVQKITGHKTLSMLLRYTQMNVDHVVDRLDAIEPTKALHRLPVTAFAVQPPDSAPASVGIPEELPKNVIPFRGTPLVSGVGRRFRNGGPSVSPVPATDPAIYPAISGSVDIPIT